MYILREKMSGNMLNSIADVKFTINHAKNIVFPEKEIIKESNKFINEISEKIKTGVSQGATIVKYVMPKKLDVQGMDENRRDVITRAVFKIIVDKFGEKGAGFTVKYSQINPNEIQLEFSGWMPEEIFTNSKKFLEYINKK
jgi:hypothetical protein